SMPVWMAIFAHFLLPDDPITGRKAIGLALALAGVIWAMAVRDPTLHGSLWGDLAALGAAIGWAATAMMAKASPLRQARPEVQLWIQVAVSGPILVIAALFFGDLVRDLQPIHLWGLGFQIVVVVSAGFIFWLWLLSVYPASGVASFSFLSPVFSVLLGWLLLDEPIGAGIVVALVLVAAGIVLINRPKARRS
ncbi:MAG: DMT family transporter, partial [Rhodobacteraceae bacterium]|nr:DMT family transporter [Paracoccaceae bacterium]